MSTLTEERDVTLAAPVAQAQRALGADAGDLRLLSRWLLSMGFVALALAVCVWARMAVRQTALELDAARSALSRAEMQRERLIVERSLLRDPGRLADSAEALGLVAPVATVNVQATGAEAP